MGKRKCHARQNASSRSAPSLTETCSRLRLTRFRAFAQFASRGIVQWRHGTERCVKYRTLLRIHNELINMNLGKNIHRMYKIQANNI